MYARKPKAIVAQIFDLLYRRIAFRESSDTPTAFTESHGQPSATRRYSRVQLCATAVAQIFNLLYRRIAFCEPSDTPTAFTESRGQPSATRRYSRVQLCATVVALTLASVAWADDFAALCHDRAAIERVYYNHRLGAKPPFEKTLPPALIEQLVRQDLRKEAVLRSVYGVVITPVILDAEVQRINTTTRAPEVLAELKAALDNDANRFARTVAKPIIVERLLRNRFENDDRLHSPERRQAEATRSRLLNAAAGATASIANEARAARLMGVMTNDHVGAFSESTWQLGPPPNETDGAQDPSEAELKKRFGPNAQLLSPGHADTDRKSYFDDLPPDLQRVLRAQLRGPGDVSAVIETPSAFLLYLCKEKSAETLSVAALFVPKTNYEEWLSRQGEPKPANSAGEPNRGVK